MLLLEVATDATVLAPPVIPALVFALIVAELGTVSPSTLEAGVETEVTVDRPEELGSASADEWFWNLIVY